MNAATVALIGRPNVGKSTLFNRIAGGRKAIVDERPGSTRDRHFGKGEWNGRAFWLVDTGGLLPSSEEPMDAAIRTQVEMAVAAADVVLLLTEVDVGPAPADQEIAEYLRGKGKPVILVVNKADQLAKETRHLAFWELGLGDPVPVSAATGKGVGDLLDVVAAALPEAPEPETEDAVAVAVVGRPNVGKSSLVNRLLGEDRHIVAPEPGTTRDAIDSPLTYKSRTLTFIDTAGLRRRGKIDEAVEFYALLRTQRAIERADVCVIVVDAADGLHTQDLKVAAQAWDAGTGLVVAVNKWDLVEKDTKTAEAGRKKAVERAPFLADVPFIFVSALTGQRAAKVLDAVLEVAEARRGRVQTAEVNRAIKEMVAERQPPQAGGAEVKLLYGSQIGEAPPTFAIVSSRPDSIPDSYRRFVINGLRARFGFLGTPIRLRFTRRRRAGVA
ncbi:MAG TPA: ribosome biogenesis GTPase Der [Gemmatimonadales bacterium]|nr:ribosome biogenesis GTPase Der [Gemmatimonadales bacterium]